MKRQKIYVVKSSMRRTSSTEGFVWWETYGVFSSRKTALLAIEQSFKINKGWNWTADVYNPDHFDYDLLSTDGTPCKTRVIIETHILNKGW